MSTATVEAEVRVTLDGKTQIHDVIQVPAEKHYEIKLEMFEIECTCPPPLGELPKGTQLTTEEQLDLLPVGTIVADKDHDDWEKADSSEWVHKQGPHVRAKTLVALWGPLTLVRLP